MTSFIELSNLRPAASLLGLLLIVALATVGAHVAMDPVARHAETDLGAYLWWQEEYFQLFSGANYEGRGANRLMIAGPSEAREGFIDQRLTQGLAGLVAYNHAQSIGTLRDTLIALEYIERSYGKDAMPRALLLAITPRYTAGLSVDRSPLVEAVNRYSPVWSVDDDRQPPRLVAKSRLQATRASFRLYRRQQRRYSLALRATVVPLAERIWPGSDFVAWLKRPLKPSKFHHLPHREEEKSRASLALGPIWKMVHGWNPDQDRDKMEAELRALRDFATRNEMEIYLVSMPEYSWNRRRFDPSNYAAYIEQTRAGLPGAPFLDLREHLADAQFFDDCHPDQSGAIEISDRTAEFVVANRKAAQRARQSW